LPVPDCAWAMVSLPDMMGMIALAWMGLGRSQPKPVQRRRWKERRWEGGRKGG
jgi:hypothetical protein